LIASSKNNQIPNKEGTTTLQWKGRVEIIKRVIDHAINASLYPIRSKIPVSSIAAWKAQQLKELKICVLQEQNAKNQGNSK